MSRRTLFSGALVSVVLIGALVGGSYAIFTDTEAMHAKFEAGTIDIEVNDAEPGYQEFFIDPIGYVDWKPGDHSYWDLKIHNKGTNRAWIQIYVYPTGAWDDVPDLWTCEPNEDCSPTYEWEDLDDGQYGSWNAWLLNFSNTLRLRLHVDFPQCAGNSCQGAQGDLLILVVAKQWRHKYEEGYSCVALEDKDSHWLPILDNAREGIVCYKVDENKHLHVVVNAYGLTPLKYYQLSLNGSGGCANFEDTTFAGLTANLYHSGWWTGGTTSLSPSCSQSWHQGVYNIAGTDGGVQADSTGQLSVDITIDGSGTWNLTLPSGTYEDVKFLIKEISGYSGGAPSHADHGTNWIGKLMEMDYLSFTIP